MNCSNALRSFYLDSLRCHEQTEHCGEEESVRSEAFTTTAIVSSKPTRLHGLYKAEDHNPRDSRNERCYIQLRGAVL
jgi:hypothetical protein